MCIYSVPLKYLNSLRYLFHILPRRLIFGMKSTFFQIIFQFWENKKKMYGATTLLFQSFDNLNKFSSKCAHLKMMISVLEPFD